MSKLVWNSDAIHVKKQIKREKRLPKSGSDSSGTHESFPVHGLADRDGCERKASVLLGGDEVEDGGSEEHSPHRMFKVSPRGEEDKIQQTVPDLTSRPLKGGKLILRPYGLDEEAMAKAELLQKVLEGHFELDGPGRKVVVGDQVVELDFLCAKMGDSDVHDVKTLHRERSIDVSVVQTSRFGEVVRKTYLTQTMRRPFRPHSCLQDQLLYEAAIVKSLSKVDGVLPVLAWSHCSPAWFPECDTYHLRSLYFPHIEGNYSPTELWDIHSYMKQLLQVLDALHLRETVHCNIKRENVLFADGKLTLIDFESAVNEHELVDMGNSEFGNDLEVCYRSNPYHSAPEVLKPQPGRSKHGRNVLYGHRRDVYGAGIILAELLLGMDERTRLFNHDVCGRSNRADLRKKFSETLQGRRGNMQEALDGLRKYGTLKGTKFYKHGADLVKHMTLWSRFERVRAWEALQHSFFSVDPEDSEKVPEFATMQQRLVQPVTELEEFVDHDDDYLFDRHYHFDRHDDYDDPTFGSWIGEHVPSWIANEPTDPEDMYWYGKEGMDYIYDGAHRNF